MDVNIDTSQFKILYDFYNGLSSIDQTKIWMSAYRKASKPLLDAARANVPKRGMGLYRSLGIIEMPENNSIEIGSKTNTSHIVNHKGKSSIGKVWYAHLLEWGTGDREWKKRRTHKSKNTGRVKATHFFENAWNSTASKVEESINQEWINSIDQFIIRANKKAR